MPAPDVKPELPLVTYGLPPTGGRVRAEPEDFQVDEVPAYEPCGEGEHLFVGVRKRGHTTDAVARALGRTLGLPRGDVTYAGQKDRHAVTTQTFCIPAAAAPALDGFVMDDVEILWAKRHTNRLRTGHLRANRFRILLRDPDEGGGERAQAIATRLRDRGLPNAFGPQRFGRDGDTARDGLQLLADPQRGPGARDRYRRKLNLSAAQALLYNHYLAERARDDLLATLLPGDVAQRVDSGGLFVVEDAAAEQPRLDRHEVTHCGPIFGRKTFPAADVAARREQAVLDAFGLTPEHFAPFGKLANGTRRANLVYLDDLTVSEVEGGIALAFTLPSGSYATVVLREFLKQEVR